MWTCELRVSRMFKAWEELKAAASEKRRELEARAGTQHCKGQSNVSIACQVRIGLLLGHVRRGGQNDEV